MLGAKVCLSFNRCIGNQVESFFKAGTLVAKRVKSNLNEINVETKKKKSIIKNLDTCSDEIVYFDHDY
jgi:hypothetical protein